MPSRSGHAPTTLSHSDYTIGWICALPKELSASEAMLDTIHEALPNSGNDSNTYTLGSIDAHNIVIACLPSGYYGNNNAATVASNLRRTFPSVRLCLMVGIGGGAPGTADIRLGDIVIGQGVVQYDLGKTGIGGSFKRTGNMSKPAQELLTAVAKLRAAHDRQPSEIPQILSRMIQQNPLMTRYIYNDQLQDRLFDSTYEHISPEENPQEDCGLCDANKLIQRPLREIPGPQIHYGTIASGNRVVKHGKMRDDLARELDALCFEMEGAGVMDSFAALVIRGICDYCDSHKNEQWQEVAAAVAAAYAKELLLLLPTNATQTAPILAVSSMDQAAPTVAISSTNAGKWDVEPYLIILSY